jgi:hypothetical protein
MKPFLILTLLCVLSYACAAQTQDCLALTQSALDESGFFADIDAQAALAGSPELAKNVIESWQLPATSGPVVQAAMRKGLDAAVLKAELLKLVAARCVPAKMNQVVGQLSDPLVVKIVAMETAAKSPQGLTELSNYERTHGQDIPGLPRMAQLTKMDNSIGLTDFSLKLFLAVQSGMADGLGVRGAKNIKATYIGEMGKAWFGGSNLHASIFTYRAVSDQDLRQYVQILSTEPVKGFYVLTMQSLLTIYEQRGGIIGEEIKNNLPPGSISPAAISLGNAGKKDTGSSSKPH